MKRIIFTLLIAFAAAYVAFGQDSLYVGTPQTDTLQDALIGCYPYSCTPNASHTYIVATAYNGAIDISGDGLFEVLVMTEDYVHFDTCGIAQPFAGAELRLLFDFPAACRIIINAQEGMAITVGGKVDTLVTRALPAPICSTDTLCTPTAITNQQQQPATYFDLEALGKVVLKGDLLPNRRYKRIR